MVGEPLRRRACKHHDDILRLYRSRWELKPPVWVAVELLDFGMLPSAFFRQFLTKAQQIEISRTFGISQGSFLVNWIKVLNHIRNVCAHHARLWNQPVTFRLQRIPTGMSPLLDSLHGLTGTPKTRIYPVLYLCAFLLDSLGDNSDWTNKAHILLASFPNSLRAAFQRSPTGQSSSASPVPRDNEGAKRRKMDRSQ